MDFSYINDLDIELKISLEDEGLTFDQAVSIACQAHSNNVKVTMKVGGAEAISDMRFAKMIGSSGCVAPMIESPFALHKFINANNTHQFNFDNLYINIESKQAYESINDILNSSDAKYLSGIVLGRSDFISSFGMTKDKTDSSECYDKAVKIFEAAKSKDKITLMGGNINTNSQEFVTNLYEQKLLDYVETRNVKVKLSYSFLENYSDNLAKMLEFESSLLQYKSSTLDLLSANDKKRLNNLRTRSN